MSERNRKTELYRAGKIAQPTNWSCWAAVMAMVTDTTCEDVFAFIGHDGGEYDPEGVEIEGALRAGFVDVEAYVYLLRHGFRVGTTFDGDFDPDCWQGFPAILYVASERYKGATHMVFWDGEVVHDPNPEAAERRSAEEYTVKWYEQVISLWRDGRYLSVQSRIRIDP